MTALPKYHNAVRLNEQTNKFELYRIKNPFITSYYITGQYEALTYIMTLHPNYYVLFVGYTDGDMQPGITGSCIKYNFREFEESSNAAIRELKEETGFTVHPDNLILFDNRECEKIGRNGVLYLADAETCVISKNVKISRRGSSNKIAILIYGSYYDIMNMITNANPIDPQEKISYYACVHITHAVEITNRIKCKRANGFIETFIYKT